MLDWLKGILPEHLHIHLDFSPKLEIKNVKIGSENTKHAPVLVQGNTLSLDDTTDDGKQIIEATIKNLPDKLEHNDVVLEEDELAEYNRIEADIAESDYDQKLTELKRIIPRKDYPIIEVVLLIAIKFHKGENIAKEKSDLVARYEARGAMISNLYTSGYFDTLIVPLYETMVEGTIAMDEYLESYETIVTESPLAMFIGVGATIEKFKAQLLAKIESNKNSEVGYLNIHGIGATNMGIIKKLLEDEEVASLFTIEPTIIKSNKTFKATIYFM